MLQAIARCILKTGRWEAVGAIPAAKKAVIIAAPHTSNWDGFWLIVYKIAINIEVRFFAKHTLFWWPLGPLLRSLGAIPIERTRSGANVSKLVELFAANDQLLLALSPEGTRKWQPYWRTGFYRIADAADVPIVLGFIDYRRRRLGMGIQIDTYGGEDTTLEKIRDFYRDCYPARPKNRGPIAFPQR